MKIISPIEQKLLNMLIPKEMHGQAVARLQNNEDLLDLMDDDNPFIVKSYDDIKFMRPTCECGECDSFGHLIHEDGTAEKCPTKYKKDLLRKFDDWMESNNWENYPPPGLNDSRWKETITFNAVKQFAYKLDIAQPKGLFLCGKYGVSKTYPAMALLRQFVKEGYKVCAVRLPDFVERIRDFKQKEYINRVFKQIDESKLVLVDEVGRDMKYGNHEFADSAINHLVDAVHKKKHCIFTSNNTRKQLAEQLSDYAISRLCKQSGYCTFIDDFDSEPVRGMM